MKKHIQKKTVAFLLVFLFALSPLMADTDHDDLSVDKVIEEIMQSQGVSNEKDIDINKVSSELLEKLGDAVMEETHPGAAHEFMDNMMGGEGSETLKQAHINMGYNYLLSITEGRDRGWGMMGSYNMMGAGMMGGYGMMGSWGGGPFNFFYRYGGTVMMIFGFLILAGLVALIVLGAKQTGFFKNLTSNDDENPLDILDRRLARGEITEEEYERLKKRITQ